MKKWFWADASGVNADIERHCAKESILDARIAELEGKGDPASVSALQVYRGLRVSLLQSKATVVSKIGKKNDKATKR